jgi:hypothetical protein
MKPISWVGILLIVLGALVLAIKASTTHGRKKSSMWDRCISPQKLTSEFPFPQYLEGWDWLEGSSCWSWGRGTSHRPD